MNISELESALALKTVQADYDDRPLAGAYTSDLLSDVMARAGADYALITIQAHRNTMAVAAMLNLGAVIICNDRPIPEDMLEAAKDERIALFLSGKTQFQLSGLLYAALGRALGAPKGEIAPEARG